MQNNNIVGLDNSGTTSLEQSGQSAIIHIREHLQTAALPPVLQSLFKNPEERTASERTALDNYGIDTSATLGNGEGKSGLFRAVVTLCNTLDSELDADSIDPGDAVSETVGSLQFEAMSDLEFRQSLRDFRADVSTALDSKATIDQREAFSETLQRYSNELQESHEEIEPQRPFKRVDLQGPDTQRHSRWHVQAMRLRCVETPLNYPDNCITSDSKRWPTNGGVNNDAER